MKAIGVLFFIIFVSSRAHALCIQDDNGEVLNCFDSQLADAKLEIDRVKEAIRVDLSRMVLDGKNFLGFSTMDNLVVKTRKLRNKFDVERDRCSVKQAFCQDLGEVLDVFGIFEQSWELKCKLDYRSCLEKVLEREVSHEKAKLEQERNYERIMRVVKRFIDKEILDETSMDYILDEISKETSSYKSGSASYASPVEKQSPPLSPGLWKCKKTYIVTNGIPGESKEVCVLADPSSFGEF